MKNILPFLMALLLVLTGCATWNDSSGTTHYELNTKTIREAVFGADEEQAATKQNTSVANSTLIKGYGINKGYEGSGMWDVNGFFSVNVVNQGTGLDVSLKNISQKTSTVLVACEWRKYPFDWMETLPVETKIGTFSIKPNKTRTIHIAIPGNLKTKECFANILISPAS